MENSISMNFSKTFNKYIVHANNYWLPFEYQRVIIAINLIISFKSIIETFTETSKIEWRHFYSEFTMS